MGTYAEAVKAVSKMNRDYLQADITNQVYGPITSKVAEYLIGKGHITLKQAERLGCKGLARSVAVIRDTGVTVSKVRNAGQVAYALE